MKKYKFVKIVYDDDINKLDIVAHINKLREIFRGKVDLQHFDTSYYNEEMADYVCYAINDNPVG